MWSLPRTPRPWPYGVRHAFRPCQQRGFDVAEVALDPTEAEDEVNAQVPARRCRGCAPGSGMAGSARGGVEPSGYQRTRYSAARHCNRASATGPSALPSTAHEAKRRQRRG